MHGDHAGERPVQKRIAASSIREVDSTRTAVDAQFCAVPIELSKDHRRSCVN